MFFFLRKAKFPSKFHTCFPQSVVKWFVPAAVQFPLSYFRAIHQIALQYRVVP